MAVQTKKMSKQKYINKKKSEMKKKKKEKVKCLQYCKIWLGLDHIHTFTAEHILREKGESNCLFDHKNVRNCIF